MTWLITNVSLWCRKESEKASINDVGLIRYPHGEKNESWSWVTDVSIKAKTTKLLGNEIFSHWYGQRFPKYDTESTAYKGKVINYTIFKFKF